MFFRTACLIACTFLTLSASAQQHDMSQMDHSQMDHSHMQMDQGMDMSSPIMQRMMNPHTFIDSILNHGTSGTSAQPNSTPMPMLMKQTGPWMFMVHGTAQITDTQQSGPRGADKLYSTNWIMPMVLRDLGPGELTLRAMFSIEPATITGRYFPELFQQGETAFGNPIIDGQHPHDFFMELAALYDLKLNHNTLLSFYAAPIGDPAIGPIAYPHRWSASENPIATLSHHQQDSTHIAFNVVTTGLTYKIFRIEESGFHGGEPSEARWQFQPSTNGRNIDSYSTRISLNPTRDWSGQYSFAHIKSPEALHPNSEGLLTSPDQQRQTASIMYNHAWGRSLAMDGTANNLAATAIWGRTRSLADNTKSNSYTLEALYQFRTSHHLWTRIENAARTTELALTPNTSEPTHFEEEPAGHVAASSFGYDYDLHPHFHIAAAPGVQYTTYRTPGALTSIYGPHPFAAQLFLRLRITSR